MVVKNAYIVGEVIDDSPARRYFTMTSDDSLYDIANGKIIKLSVMGKQTTQPTITTNYRFNYKSGIGIID